MDRRNLAQAAKRRDTGAGLPAAIVMNMYYTGLGIARSLGENGVPVLGLTSKSRVYGNFTRYAKTVRCPDSRDEPEALRTFLLRLGGTLESPGVIFPTRDNDLIFLERYRAELAPYFSVVMPESSVLNVCLDKWQTYLWERRAGIATPKCWKIEGLEDLGRFAPELTYPSVLKPLSAYHWRQGNNWNVVGARKAIGIDTGEQLLQEYAAIARADQRALLQEMVPGGDDSLIVAACYLDRQARWVAGFNAQKRVQIPEGFGTGCIVQSVALPGLLESTARLLEAMGFSGIAEVEYKRDAASGEYKLIEINPRPWDQHRLGKACGVDLIYMTYCEHAGLAPPACAKPVPGHKWIAEDAFVLETMRLLWRRDPKWRSLLREARGKRIYAIWSARDPLPLIAYTITELIPGLLGSGVRAAWSALKRMLSGTVHPDDKRGLVYENQLEKRQNPS